MQFDLLSHEEHVLNFYEEQIKETTELELKKQLLQHYYDYLSSLHTMEKEYRNTMAKHEQEMKGKDIDLETIRREPHRDRRSRRQSKEKGVVIAP
ncbi:hypothetical protein [Bacterioplanoides pacificum]|uniref:Uncharacterized protein n=1 Tax=Bacterioplanoides pacificum TaxID=1171596 RepID=A0ABV7VQM1_9GAMM